MELAGKWKIDLASEHQIYKNAAGKRLPGVTTVLGVLAKPALLGWYADMEREHVVKWAGDLARVPDAHVDFRNWRGVLRDLVGEPWAANIKRDRAADIGTVTHARCEAFLHGMELDEEALDAELVDKSMNGFIRFHDWWAAEGLEVVHSELQMVSEAMQVGGTADIIARRRSGALVLVDLKTSKASKWWPYPETFGQVSCYAAMYEETSGQIIEEIHVARIGKEESDPGQSVRLTPDERAAGLRLFRAALEAHNAQKELKR